MRRALEELRRQRRLARLLGLGGRVEIDRVEDERAEQERRDGGVIEERWREVAQPLHHQRRARADPELHDALRRRHRLRVERLILVVVDNGPHAGREVREGGGELVVVDEVEAKEGRVRRARVPLKDLIREAHVRRRPVGTLAGTNEPRTSKEVHAIKLELEVGARHGNDGGKNGIPVTLVSDVQRGGEGNRAHT